MKKKYTKRPGTFLFTYTTSSMKTWVKAQAKKKGTDMSGYMNSLLKKAKSKSIHA